MRGLLRPLKKIRPPVDVRPRRWRTRTRGPPRCGRCPRCTGGRAMRQSAPSRLTVTSMSAPSASPREQVADSRSGRRAGESVSAVRARCLGRIAPASRTMRRCRPRALLPLPRRRRRTRTPTTLAACARTFADAAGHARIDDQRPPAHLPERGDPALELGKRLALCDSRRAARAELTDAVTIATTANTARRSTSSVPMWKEL